MKVDRIAVKYYRKFNLGDYNASDLECSAWASLEEDDTPEECIDELFDLCRDKVKERALPMIDKDHVTSENFKQMFQGLPVEMQVAARKAGYKF